LAFHALAPITWNKLPEETIPLKIRDIGIATVKMMPKLEKLGRKVYARLPACLHDTPSSRLRAFFARDEEIAFIQIGAYDGIAGDPIRAIVIERDCWHGLLIEPQRNVFERLRSNYSALAMRVQFLNAAISDRSGERSFFSIPDAELQRLGLPNWAGEIASFEVNHIENHFPSAQIETIKIKTLTFAEAAGYLPDSRADLVVMDVEGHERVIIENIDMDRHRVRFIIFEHKHMARADKVHVVRILRKQGFSLKEFGRDTIAYRYLT
jgi:FkbM family methyltransferase